VEGGGTHWTLNWIQVGPIVTKGGEKEGDPQKTRGRGGGKRNIERRCSRVITRGIATLRWSEALTLPILEKGEVMERGGERWPEGDQA